MKDREPISETQQKVDIIRSTFSGGVIGIIGAIVESNIVSKPNIDTDAAIIFGGATIVGASLVVNGAVRFIASRKRRE
ncbi:MAG TPA: hypothetical protein VES68_02010 [Candidatus Sulfotelmatobacter sp.]|nr:hypothetical protein [Candidatus Sulfotelmatobacter sp.]